MERLVNTWTVPLILSAIFVLVGCNREPSPAPTSATEQHHEGDGHDHEGDDHEGHDHGAADHPSEGPHHGHLIELGQEEYHAELVHDEAAQTVEIYLLDRGAKAPVSVPDSQLVLNLAVAGTTRQVTLAAAPQEGDRDGEASRFSVTDASAIEALDAPSSTGRINVSIGGKAYSGSFKHAEHGEHEH